MSDVGLDELITEAAAAGATDVLLNPGTLVGKLMVRAAGETLLSRMVDPAVLRGLSVQVGMRTGLPALLGGGEASPGAPGVSSFERPDGLRVRVICTPSTAGPLVRLRLQSTALLARARDQFQAGAYGGCDVLRFLHAPSGVAFVAGPVASGKTSALHHLAGSLPGDGRPLIVVSEAREFEYGDERMRPSDEAAVRLGDAAPATVALDEMDETEKLGRALALGGRHRVLATLAAPNLVAALRRIQAARMAAAGADGCVIGVLRVGWQSRSEAEMGSRLPGGRQERSGSALRFPHYAWYAFRRFGAGACPCCGAGISADEGEGGCARCGNDRTAAELGLLPGSLLEDPQSLDAYHAAERLEPARPLEPGGEPWTARPSRN